MSRKGLSTIDALEALGAAQMTLWMWEPALDRLSFSGAARLLGLGPLAPECPSAALRALAMPQDRAFAEDLLAVRDPHTPVLANFRLRGGQASVWRGVWLEEGVRAAGVVYPGHAEREAGRDQLTGLLDRGGFLAAARDRLSRPGLWRLMVADLDRLRRLNEALGHERADLVLAALGSRLAAAAPADSVCGRIGEDEFALLIPDASATGVGELRQALEQPLRIAGFDIHPTLSLGAVTAGGGPDAPEVAELLRRAELAVESAKTGGRGGAAAYGRAMESDGLSRLALEADLRGAMGRGEIGPFYQPVVRLSNGALSGFEALARWRHPRRGLVGPDQFLPLLEEMGLMNDLGVLMTRAAAAQLASWRRSHASAADLWVSVNLSTGELDRPDLVSDVRDIIAISDLRPGALKLEVTESDIMRDPDKAAIVLQQLRDAGAAIALDDFGTGFSSLSYLSRLPFDTLKIDRYFVRTMGEDAGSEKIVRSVVKLGQDLNLEVVAEGVENSIVARALLAVGCDYGQGFGYAQPLSPLEAEVYLNEAEVDGEAPLKARG